MNKMKRILLGITMLFTFPMTTFADTGNTEVFMSVPASPVMIDKVVTPQTGDTTSIFPVVIAIGIALLILLLLIFFKKRKEKKDEHQ